MYGRIGRGDPLDELEIAPERERVLALGLAIAILRRAMQERVLAVLVFVYVLNLVDRNLMSMLLESSKRDLAVSDSLMGLLVGPAFAVLYTVAGIPIARLADRHSRRAVLAVGLTVWSLATAASGLVRSYAQMAL